MTEYRILRGGLEETLDECPPQTAGYMDRGNARASHRAYIVGHNAKPWKDKEFRGSEDTNDTPIEVCRT